MKNVPRILPLVGIAVGGVLAINAMAGAKSLPDLLGGAKAFAEGVAKPEGKKAEGEQAASAEGAGQPAAANAPPPRVCAPSADALAKEAGLSPAELRVLQSLGARRGQLDQREQDIDVQLQLLAAAEAKLDAKMKSLTGLKGDIQGLLGQVDNQKQAEVDRLVTVYQGMKPKDAAARITLLSDEVRLPIAAKMKERALSQILANMAPGEAKILTERLASRMANPAVEKGKAAIAENAAAAPGAAAPTQQADAGLAGAAAPKAKSAPKKAG
ncbi:MotE family protein [Caulobacter sp.]|uniref:MotE family protein n=1 Tax=Caulobacter sp. TaxID=78 RepID=UPI001B03D9C8|nr:MotE family protein [Caulobacter sp.]MBO9543004.1 MotE family protein [Caulobacter sp.]